MHTADSGLNCNSFRCAAPCAPPATLECVTECVEKRSFRVEKCDRFQLPQHFFPQQVFDKTLHYKWNMKAFAVNLVHYNSINVRDWVHQCKTTRLDGLTIETACWTERSLTFFLVVYILDRTTILAKHVFCRRWMSSGKQIWRDVVRRLMGERHHNTHPKLPSLFCGTQHQGWGK
jgi:hypothetical protein